MAGKKEIRSKIASVKSTQKITKAMEMVAASKMRRSQDRMQSIRSYARAILRVINRVAEANLEYRHPYFSNGDTGRVGYLIISTDRGLCGGLNTNLFRKTLLNMHSWRDRGVSVEAALIGLKAATFFKRHDDIKISSHISGLSKIPERERVISSVEAMLEKYDEGNLNRIYLAYNSFVSPMVQKPQIYQLLPFQKANQDKTSTSTSRWAWDYLYEPEPRSVLSVLLKRYIDSQVYQAFVENFACEQSARTVAMRAATDNAERRVDDLELIYNKGRQSSITQELTEIVSGAAAL